MFWLVATDNGGRTWDLGISKTVADAFLGPASGRQTVDLQVVVVYDRNSKVAGEV